MKAPLEAMLELWAASDEYVNSPTDTNKQRYEKALEVVKRYERQSEMAEFEGIADGQLERTDQASRHIPKVRTRLSLGSLVNVATLIVVLVILVAVIQGQSLLRMTSTTNLTLMETTVAGATEEHDTICGGSQRSPISDEARGTSRGTFRRDLGMTLYNVENTFGGVVDNKIRAVTVDERGVWFGYHDLENATAIEGIGQYDRQSWENCQSSSEIIGENTNAININTNADVWVATDGSGIAVYDGQGWQTFGIDEGLPSDQTYDIVFDSNNNVWVATLEGVARFDGGDWTTAYSVLRGDSISSNLIHAIAFHSDGEIWIGYISSGMSRFTVEGEWRHYTTENDPTVLASNSVRDIVVDGNGDVWIATDGGGISQLSASTQEWHIYTVDSSEIPSDNVYALAIDRFDRVWASTSEGISYFQDGIWHLYSTITSIDLAFGPACTDCPYNNDHVWVATGSQGLAHARIAPLSEVIRVEAVEHPEQVAPGEEFSPKVRVRVLHGYELDASDGLFFTGTDDSTLFEAWPTIPVKNLISPGQVYEFYAPETPFIAPQEPGYYTSTWRIWQDGRYVGPEINIEFTVLEPDVGNE